MSDSTKYELFLNEINALEKEVYKAVQNGDKLYEENKRLNDQLEELRSENELLKLKIEELKSGENRKPEKIIDTEENKILKTKINDLISRIDYHLRS